MHQLKDLGAQKVCLPCLFHLQQWDCELATNLKIAESSIRSLPLFKFSVPLHLLIQIVCTDHWSGRNCRWTPEHCTSHHSVTCFLANQEPFRMSQGDWSLGVLLVRTLADSKRHSSWWSCHPFQFAETVAIAASYQCPNNGATASSVRNGKTQPTHRLGCTRVVRTLSFPYAIPLWSSIEQWDCERVSRKSQQHRNPSLTKGKQMSCCRIQVAPGGSRSFSKPWHWIWLHSLCLFFKTPQSFAHKPGQKQVPSGATFIFILQYGVVLQAPGTWLTACFHLPSGNRGKFAWTAQVYDFGWFGGSGQSKYNWLAATGISGLSTHGSSRQTTTSTESMVSRNLTMGGWERKLTKMNWMDGSMLNEL